MGAKSMKLITVPLNGQISIGKGWAGRQISVVEVNENEIHISAGTFVPDSQKTFFTPKANKSLDKYNAYEKSNPPKATNTKALFSSLKKKKSDRGK